MIRGGVHLGCVVSPDLLSSLHCETKEGFAMRGRNINHVRYAHDMVLIADSQEKLHDIVAVKEVSEAKDLTNFQHRKDRSDSDQ